QHARPSHERAREQHAAELAVRKLRLQPVGEARQIELLEERVDACALVGREPTDEADALVEAGRDRVPDRGAISVARLELGRDPRALAARRAETPGRAEGRPVDRAAAGRPQLTGGGPQERALAGAVRPLDGPVLAGARAPVDAAQHAAVPEPDVRAADLDQRLL